MPNIVGLDVNPAVGITIYDKRGNAHTFTNAEIEDYLSSHNVEKTEEQVVNWANANIFAQENDQCAVHIYTDEFGNPLEPLKVTCIVAIVNYSVNEPYWDDILYMWVDNWVTYQYEIPDGWWE